MAARWTGSSAPHSSRAECMESWATPTSTVSIPSRAAVTGPIVDPQGWSLRLTKTWWGTPATSQARTSTAWLVPLVA